MATPKHEVEKLEEADGTSNVEKFWEAKEVEDIAKPIIASYLPELVEAKIKYYFKEKCSKKGSTMVYGKTAKVSDKNSFLMGGFNYLLELGADGWRELTVRQREALVYHLLNYCHVDVDDKTNEYTYGLKDPDIIEFTDVLSRYGFWHPDLEKFGRTIKAIDFDNSKPSDPKKVVPALPIS